MNSEDGLSEHRHDQSIGRISAWELHVVSELVRGNALQNELASISVFAFVALEWNSKEPNSDGNNDAEDDYRQKPPTSSQAPAVIVSPMTHKRCYSNEKREVASRSFGINADSSNLWEFLAFTKLRRGRSPFAIIRITFW
jgi:hypothetical protein